MKKFLIVLVALTALPPSVACGNNVASYVSEIIESESSEEGEQPIYPLVFNAPRTAGVRYVTPMPHAFWLDLTDTQIDAIFPTLDLPFTATAYYSRDGVFAELDARTPLSDAPRHKIQILVSTGVFRRMLNGYNFEDNFIPQISYVHDIPVTALIIDSPNGSYSFHADFKIDDIAFHIRFSDNNKVDGQALMADIVNGLILGGTEWLGVLDNPIIPELRSERLTLEEAFNDPYFGRFMPANIPEGFQDRNGAGRSVHGHVNVNDMFVQWDSSFDYDYLYEVYTSWVEAQGDNAIVFPFEQIRWGIPSVSWHISKVQEFELERLVSVEDRRKYDWNNWSGRHIPFEYSCFVRDPVFIAEEFTLDVLRAREELRSLRIEGAHNNRGATSRFIYLSRNFIQFGVLFDDVLVRIEAQGLTYEQVWLMLESLIENLD